MAQIHVGPKTFINHVKHDTQQEKDVFDNTVLLLQNKLSELEHQLGEREILVVEKIKEVPFEVKVIEERIVEKIIEVIKEVPITITNHIETEVVKEVTVVEEKIVEVIKEVEKFIDREIKYIPRWVLAIILLQSLLILFLLVH